MATTGLTYAKAWRGIVPLQTTRTAVEQSLGKPTMDRGDTVVYDFEKERASIEYSKGPCSVKFSQWNVPRETVISIWVTPKTDLNIKDLGLGRSYKMVRDEHRLEVIHYIDEKAGIEYNVDEASGIVGLIKYRPTAADKPLRCLSHGKKVIKWGHLTGTVAFPGAVKEWGRIVPLHSTRADVERLLKVKPERCGRNACVYDLPEKTVFAVYADEPTCRNDDATSSWKVPRDTVIEITVHFKTPQLFSTLGIDTKKYDRAPDPELHGLVYLTDYAQGIRMETSGDTVRAITYYSAKTDDHLRCPPNR